jgi:hypothetical protein
MAVGVESTGELDPRSHRVTWGLFTCRARYNQWHENT